MSVKLENSFTQEEFETQPTEVYVKRRMMSAPEGDIKKAKLDCDAKLESEISIIEPTMLQPDNGENYKLSSGNDCGNNNNHPNAVNLNTVTGLVDKSNNSNDQEQDDSQPSNVVHVRNLPNDLADAELIRFALRFGKLSNYLVLVGKGQAFLEFATQESAKAAIAAGSGSTPLVLKSRQLYLQNSKHRRLQTNLPNQLMINSVTEATGHNGNSHNNSLSDAISNGNAIHSSETRPNPKSGQPGPVLRVVVENLVYIVPLETFQELFSRYGNVTKIVIFHKKGAFQALIQFEQPSCAATAKSALNGQQMFPTGNVLRIDYSMMTNLSVKYNNEKSRDFTNPSLPTTSMPMAAAMGLQSNQGGHNQSAALGLSHPGIGLNSSNSVGNASQYLDSMRTGTDSLPMGNFNCFNMSGSMSFNGMRSSMPAALGGVQNNSLNLFQTSGQMSLSPVLLVTNLPDQLATPDALFILFGVYGDVLRVKILFNKKDSALVQMNDPNQAQLVVSHLDRRKLTGKSMRVSLSKYTVVQMPKEGQPDSGLTKDYTNSPLHRFKKPGSKNFQNIFPPSATLHLSNIPPSCNEEQLRSAFENHAGVQVVQFKFFTKDQKMALIQLPSIEDAIYALVKMHDYQLSESNHLRVSFSRFSI